MNALEAASLVMIPSGYEDGTLGSLKPIDGSGDFTFSRGSNLSATRVKEDGYIEKGYENLVLQSNTFSNAAWTKSSVSVTGGQEGYDGSNDAWLLTNNNASFPRIESSATLNGVSTYSVYAKAGTNSFCQLRIFGNLNTDVWFDLSTGLSIHSTGSGLIDINSENIGNGWYRLSLIVNVNITGVRIYSAESFPIYGLGSIYIQDAQLNQGLVALPYVESGATNGLGGLLENDPRIDFTGGGCGSLLLEPSRTNLIAYSEYINKWQLVNISIEISDTLSPDGVSPMTKATFSGAGINSYIRQNLTMNAGSITVSIFVKKGLTDSYASIRIEGIDNNISVWFNLDNGTIGSETGSPTNKSIVSYGNGIYRISATTTSTTDLSFSTKIQSANTDGGDPTENATQFYWGGQAEQGSFITSYIPTYGVSQTRAEDVCTDAGDVNTFNSTEGVLYAEIAALREINNNVQFLSLGSGSYTNNSVYIQLRSGANQFAVWAYSNGVNQFAEILTVTDITQFNKIAISYKLNDFKIYINGFVAQSITTYNPPTLNSLNVLEFAKDGSTPFFGKAKQVLTFNQALSDSELAALTTI